MLSLFALSRRALVAVAVFAALAPSAWAKNKLLAFAAMVVTAVDATHSRS